MQRDGRAAKRKRRHGSNRNIARSRCPEWQVRFLGPVVALASRRAIIAATAVGPYDGSRTVTMQLKADAGITARRSPKITP
jgi:hypothetical protein